MKDSMFYVLGSMCACALRNHGMPEPVHAGKTLGAAGALSGLAHSPIKISRAPLEADISLQVCKIKPLACFLSALCDATPTVEPGVKKEKKKKKHISVCRVETHPLLKVKAAATLSDMCEHCFMTRTVVKYCI